MTSSASPRSDSLAHSTSCPAARISVIAELGRFSLARINMIGGALDVEIHPFRLERLARVSQTRLNVLGRQVIVFLKHSLHGPAATEQVNNKLDGDTRAFDDRLANQHSGVHCNSLAPIHCVSPMNRKGYSVYYTVYS